MALNGLEDKISVLCADVRNTALLGESGSYDLVFTNPPYMTDDSGLSCKTDAKTIARHETCGTVEDFWNGDHDSFLESMADAADSVVKYFDGNIVYVNVMKNMSVDCDCCAVAEDPCIADIGVLASTDPIAIDQACIDLVYNCSDTGKHHLIERIESRNGIHTIEAAATLGYGSREYELINID